VFFPDCETKTKTRHLLSVREVPKDFCARALVVSDCKGKYSDCPKGTSTYIGQNYRKKV